MRHTPLILLWFTACASPPAGAAWPDADALFRSDPDWLGADAAYSVDLGDERSLWLFGDTFIATTPARVRAESVMVRNTVGIMSGRDPTTASMSYTWGREPDGGPAAFVGGDGDPWWWPLHGLVVDDTLTLFFLTVAREPGGLGFEITGGTAFRVDDFGGPPDTWALQPLDLPDNDFGMRLGASVLLTDDHVLAYAVREPGDHDVALARWSRSRFVAGDLSSVEWFDDGAWHLQADLGGRPGPVFRNAQTEFTIGRSGSEFVAVHTEGFGSTTIGVRTASSPEGPWSSATTVFRPPESDRNDAFVYAGKAHHQLDGGGDLVVTYASNAKDFAVLVEDDSLYWPRFVRVPIDD